MKNAVCLLWMATVTAAPLACARPPVSASYTAGDSMLPSIAIGERIVVTEGGRLPERGEVVVFRAPQDPTRKYVKRVVGLPGETVSSDGSEIAIGDVPVRRCEVGPWTYDEERRSHAGALWVESFGRVKWLVFHDASGTPGPRGSWRVAPDEVFVLGDNRENSHDSRFWFGGKGGGVPPAAIVGKATPPAVPRLPKGADALQPALDHCLAALDRDDARTR